MNIIFKGKECRLVFIKYNNKNTGFKIYDTQDKLIESPTVDIGYIMNKEYVTVKNRDKKDTLGIELQKAGVLSTKLDTINMEHGGAISLYILDDKVRKMLD